MASHSRRNLRARDRRRRRHRNRVRDRALVEADAALYAAARLDPETHAGQVAGRAHHASRSGQEDAPSSSWVSALRSYLPWPLWR